MLPLAEVRLERNLKLCGGLCELKREASFRLQYHKATTAITLTGFAGSSREQLRTEWMHLYGMFTEQLPT